MRDEVIAVTGLPRAGTSMVVQMLSAGGVPVLSDDARPADKDNPRGYFEYEPVKRTFRDASWIAEAKGKGVKVVAPLVLALPPGVPCYAISIERDLDEALDSQARMLTHRGESSDHTPARRAQMKEEYSRILERAREFLAKRPDTRVLWLNHRAVLARPDAAAAAINRFLGGWLNEAAMARAVKPDLYRRRAGQSIETSRLSQQTASAPYRPAHSNSTASRPRANAPNTDRAVAAVMERISTRKRAC